MKTKKIMALLISILMLFSVLPTVFAAETMTIDGRFTISNVLRKESPMYMENVPVYICQAPVSVTLLQDSAEYAVSDIVVDEDGGFFASVGYLPDGGTHEDYWDYEKNHLFPKGLNHTLTSQSNPFYVKSVDSKNKVTEAIILIEKSQPVNPSNKVDSYTHTLWSSPVAAGTMTIRGLYDITYNKNGDTTYVIDQFSTITIDRAISALYVDNTLCTEASSLCTLPTYSTGTYSDNQFWYDSSSPLTEQTYIAPGATVSLLTPGDHTITVNLGYQSKEERTAIQSGDSFGWQNSPRIYFRVIDTTPKANYNNSQVLINGVPTDFEAYNINNNNYFKLRDIAKVISGSEKQFEVTWNGELNTIDLVTNKPYTPVGGELVPGNGEAKASMLCTSKIYKNGEEILLTAYTINNNNYFKLRDLGQAFDFDVTWDGASNRILVETDKSYTAD